MANQQMSAGQQNFLARQNLLTTGIAMIKQLQPVTASALGQQMKIPLLRMGIMTGVTLHFDVPVTIATSAAVPSSRGPWNLAQTVIYNDFVGTQRTRTNGFQLWAAQSMKQGDAMGVSPAMAQGVTLNYDTNIFNLPTATGDAVLRFSLYVPMAYDPNSDLTGAILTQTNVGEHYINVQLANALAGADPWAFPYSNTGGTVALTAGANITVTAFQHFIQPQDMSINNLPMIDLSTVYGFEGGYQTTANIAAGQDCFINLPNNRSILSTWVDFENGTAFTPNGTDLRQIAVIANSNTVFKEMTPRLVREIMRNIVNCDMPSGGYYLGSRRQPILTQLYANVQARMSVLSASAGVTQFVSQYEVQYPSGAPLPGITVAA